MPAAVCPFKCKYKNQVCRVMHGRKGDTCTITNWKNKNTGAAIKAGGYLKDKFNDITEETNYVDKKDIVYKKQSSDLPIAHL